MRSPTSCRKPGFASRLCKAVACGLLLTDGASAQVYGGRTAEGTVVLSNFPSAEASMLVLGSSATDGPAETQAVPLPVARRARDFGPMVSAVAHEVDMPAHLLHAVISVESGYLPNAVSPKGAKGLMQLMPATAKRFGVADPFDPRENVRGGALYLKWLLERFGGDLKLALAGYNAGEEAVVRAGFRVPPFPETLRYVPRVMENLQR